jgi:hypothetical protein
MQQTDITELRTKYKTLIQLSNMELSEGDPSTKHSREGMKNKAKAELPTIKQALVNQILKDSVTVIGLADVNIDEQAAQIAAGNENVVLLDYMGLDKKLSLSIFPGNGPYSFNSDSINRLNGTLADIGRDVGAVSMPLLPVSASQFSTVTDRTSITRKITQALRNAYDSDLSDIYVRFQLENAMEKKADFDKLVIVVTNVPQSSLAKVTFTGRSAVITDLPVPNAIPLEGAQTASQLMDNVGKALGTSKKKSTRKGVANSEQ